MFDRPVVTDAVPAYEPADDALGQFLRDSQARIDPVQVARRRRTASLVLAQLAMEIPDDVVTPPPTTLLEKAGA